MGILRYCSCLFGGRLVTFQLSAPDNFLSRSRSSVANVMNYIFTHILGCKPSVNYVPTFCADDVGNCSEDFIRRI